MLGPRKQVSGADSQLGGWAQSLRQGSILLEAWSFLPCLQPGFSPARIPSLGGHAMAKPGSTTGEGHCWLTSLIHDKPEQSASPCQGGATFAQEGHRAGLCSMKGWLKHSPYLTGISDKLFTFISSPKVQPTETHSSLCIASFSPSRRLPRMLGALPALPFWCVTQEGARSTKEGLSGGGAAIAIQMHLLLH